MGAQKNQKHNPLDKIIGISPSILSIKSTLMRISPTKLPVIVAGETGAGKELIARVIHELSGRKGQFVVCNLGAIPFSLAILELSGFQKGAFAGATRDKEGLIALSDNGTILLDEIREASEEVISLMIRLFKTGKILPIGSTKEQLVDARFIASTNSNDLNVLNRDLLNILSGIIINIPPLTIGEMIYCP